MGTEPVRPARALPQTARRTGPLLTAAAFLAELPCSPPWEPSGFTAATTAGRASTALRLGAALGDETTFTTDGVTFTLGLAARSRKYLINS